MTELIWKEKYKDGKKNSPIRISLPFQTIETVNESAEDRKKNLDFFTQKRETEWRNRLIWGDKKYVLPSLLPELAGKVNLIYIDPPFNVGVDFSFTATIPDNPETDEDESTTFIKQPSIIEQKAYRNFIIELYHGTPLNSYVWQHGIKAGRMIHVGSVDAPISLGDVKSIIQEFWKSVGKDSRASHSEPDSSGEESQTKVSDSLVASLPQNDMFKSRVNGIDILGWEFAFDLNETAVQHAAANKVDLKFKKIPHEVLEKKAVEQGDIHFFELAALSVKSKVKGKELELTLKDFIIPPDDVPQEVQSAISHWSQWIDYWAVDWNYRDDTFHNEWQSYRTKKEPKIDLSVKHVYEEKGNYTVLVKVIDILGNDTTKVLSVEIK